jgi:hypothetical protein
MSVPCSLVLFHWPQCQIGSEKFGALQRLHAAYCDGCLEAVKEAWMEIDPDFNSDTDVE